SVAPVAIELTERLCVFIERGDQNRIFVDFRRFADLNKRKLRRAVLVAQRKPQSALQAPAQHDHAPLPAPARQPNLALLRLEALAGAHPFPRPGELLDHAFDVGGQAQLEQEGKSARLGLAHDPLVAETAIATQQGWPEVARQAIEQPPQAWVTPCLEVCSSPGRSEEHTSDSSHGSISYAGFCLRRQSAR